jgi:hypothetical protein
MKRSPLKCLKFNFRLILAQADQDLCVAFGQPHLPLFGRGEDTSGLARMAYHGV